MSTSPIGFTGAHETMQAPLTISALVGHTQAHLKKLGNGMFRRYDKPCDKTDPHRAHWRREGFLWLDEIFCLGIPVLEHDFWRAANPAIGERIKPQKFPNSDLIDDVASGRKSINTVRKELGFPEFKPHKHLLKLTKTLVLSTGQTVDRGFVYWQCQSCWHIESVDRNELKKLLLKEKVIEQTWPS